MERCQGVLRNEGRPLELEHGEQREVEEHKRKWRSPYMERTIERDLDLILRAVGNLGGLQATHCEY